jgi:hypothetical protein
MVEKTSGLSGLAIPPLGPVRCRGSADAHGRRISLKWFDRMDRPVGAEGVSCGTEVSEDYRSIHVDVLEISCLAMDSLAIDFQFH